MLQPKFKISFVADKFGLRSISLLIFIANILHHKQNHAEIECSIEFITAICIKLFMHATFELKYDIILRKN